MILINMKGIKKDYNSDGVSVAAIRGIDLAIRKGEFTALAGPSGSGKTTLLNIVGGLDKPSSGEVTLGDINLLELSAMELSDIRLRKIGFVFQAYNLIPVLTALENVEYVLLLQKIGKEERLERARAILREVGLEKETDRLPRNMSGGQQQRVAVARAIVSEPLLILADEPTANLDRKTGEGLLDLMQELNEKKGITFLFSTHDRMVMDRARRLVHLVDGMVAEDQVKDKKSRKKEAVLV